MKAAQAWKRSGGASFPCRTAAPKSVPFLGVQRVHQAGGLKVLGLPAPISYISSRLGCLGRFRIGKLFSGGLGVVAA